MLALEVRTFEQRFGERCPFCNEPWYSQKRCDPAPRQTIRQSLSLLFSGRRPRVASPPRPRPGNRHAWREKDCVECGAKFTTQKKDQGCCSLSCSSRRRHRRAARGEGT